MLISKPKYIRKYDFIRYFTRNKDEWFWSTKLLGEYIDNKTKAFSAEQDSEEDDAETGNEQEYDVLDDLRDNKEDLDKNDPKIIEGNLIDQKSKKYVAELYPNHQIFDFDLLKIFDSDEAALKTIEILSNNDNVILLQPTFIYKDKALAKPDAFVKSAGKFYLYETKGTSTQKFQHAVDIIYQAHVVNYVLKNKFNLQLQDMFLILVEYCLAKKHEVPLIYATHPRMSSPTKANAERKAYEMTSKLKYAPEAIRIKQAIKINSESTYSYRDIYENNWSNIAFLDKKNLASERNSQTPKLTADATKNMEHISLISDINNFDKILDELIAATPCYEPQLTPTLNYKSWIKTTECWPHIRAYYTTDPKYFVFSYSGKCIQYNRALEIYASGQVHNEAELIEFCKNDTLFKPYYYRYHCQGETDKDIWKEINIKNSNHDAIGCYNDEAREYITTHNYQDRMTHQLSNKKVYFDYESINLASRVMDDTVPFMQVCNQVSVLFDHGDGNIVNKNGTTNTVIDPLEMNIDAFKKIIDAILPSDDLEVCKQYSYVVYNKSFECTRNNEMAELINEPEYSNKIKIINDNIFDLADSFTVNKSKPYIFIKELKGFYSIKKVLPLVMKYKPEIFAATGCKDYHTLQIQNGGMAQETASKRFFRILNDQEWNNYVDALKTYCENDVRAMIAVEYFAREITKNK